MENNIVFKKILADCQKDTGFYSLIRLGSVGDGGYDVSFDALKESDVFLSGGISSNVEFEYDIFRFFPHIELVMIDPTVSPFKLLLKSLIRLILPSKKNKLRYLANTFNFLYLSRQKRVLFEKVWINENYPLNEKINNRKVAIKMDIEGSEYSILDEIKRNRIDLTYLAVEFHELDRHNNQFTSFVKDMSDTHQLMKICLNNSGGHFANGLPKVLEAIFIQKKYITK